MIVAQYGRWQTRNQKSFPSDLLWIKGRAALKRGRIPWADTSGYAISSILFANFFLYEQSQVKYRVTKIFIGTKYLAQPLGWNLSYCSRLWFAKNFWFSMNALGVRANHTAFHFWETTEKTQTRVSKTDCMPLSGSYFVWENSPFYPEILGLSFFREKAFCYEDLQFN